jgi:hypothetical protein
VTVHYLYRILLPDGVYIGKAVDPQSRFSDHCRADSYVGDAIRRFGRQNCRLQILCAGSEAYISDLEQRAILKFNTKAPCGYNLDSRWAQEAARRRSRTVMSGARASPFSSSFRQTTEFRCRWSARTAKFSLSRKRI